MKIKKDKILAFFIGFILIMFFGYYVHITTEEYWYDAGLYYNASKSFVSSGLFDWKNYNVPFRGYTFPFLLYLYVWVGNCFGIGAEWISILAGNAMFASYIFTVCLPDVFPNICFYKNKFITRMILLVPVIVYWQDLIFYPLTDLYSFGIILFVVKLSLRLSNSWRIGFQGMLIGLLIYTTYNMRTIYLFSALLYGLILFVDCVKKHFGFGKMIVLYASIALGIAISSYPQYKINADQYQRKTIAVITNNVYESGLFNQQLYWGFLYDRYETFTGPVEQYPEAPMYFVDRAGEYLLQREGIDKFNSLGAYVRFVCRHPIDYLGVMVRHLMSITYMPWNHVYIYDLQKGKLFYMLFNYLILFLFGIYTYLFLKENGGKALINRNMSYLSVILFPCAAILFGAVEMRFFMPMYAFIYRMICAGNFKKAVSFVKNNLCATLLVMLVVFCILTGFWGEIMGNAKGLPQTLM